MDATVGGLPTGAGVGVGDNEGDDGDAAESEYLLEHDTGATAVGIGRRTARPLRIAGVPGVWAEAGVQAA